MHREKSVFLCVIRLSCTHNKVVALLVQSVSGGSLKPSGHWVGKREHTEDEHLTNSNHSRQALVCKLGGYDDIVARAIWVVGS